MTALVKDRRGDHSRGRKSTSIGSRGTAKNSRQGRKGFVFLYFSGWFFLCFWLPILVGRAFWGRFLRVKAFFVVLIDCLPRTSDPMAKMKDKSKINQIRRGVRMRRGQRLLCIVRGGYLTRCLRRLTRAPHKRVAVAWWRGSGQYQEGGLTRDGWLTGRKGDEVLSNTNSYTVLLLFF